MSDEVGWSDTPMFHNTLVVGSSPTSSTTQSRETGEFPPCVEMLAWSWQEPIRDHHYEWHMGNTCHWRDVTSACHEPLNIIRRDGTFG